MSINKSRTREEIGRRDYHEGEYFSSYTKRLNSAVVEAHCNCKGAYIHQGKFVTNVVRSGTGMTVVTLVNKDKETCLFCGHYALWKVEGKFRDRVVHV